MDTLVIALLEDQAQARTIKYCLEEAGHAVIVVEKFSKAKVVLEGRCDLILSDVHLRNGGNVFDFIKWVKREPLLKQIPFVLLSIEPSETARYLSDGVRVAARVLGAAKYITMSKLDPVFLLAELAEFLPLPDPIPEEPPE